MKTRLLALLLLALAFPGTAAAVCTVTPAASIIAQGQSVQLKATCGASITTVDWQKNAVSVVGSAVTIPSTTETYFTTPPTLTGSALGTNYDYTAIGNNGETAGAGARVTVLAGAPVGTPPTAVTSVVATPGVGNISVAFSGGSLGNGTLTNYAATCGANPVITGMASPIVVSAASGSGITCTITTNTSVGSATSAASNGVTVGSSSPTPPTAPTSVVATAGNAQISVAFSGGTPAGAGVSFAATCGASNTNSGATSPIVVASLANGTSYTCTVTVTTTGGSATSGASNAVTPTAPGLPDAPTIGTATPGNQQISLTFTAGNLNGGTLVNHHANCAGATQSGGSSPIVLTGLYNGSGYTCKVRTETNIGFSNWSADSNLVVPTPGSLPAAPTIGTATPGNQSISLTFTPGSLNGGTLVNYEANCLGATATGGSSPISLTGLYNGSGYTCKVRAVTNVGAGPWSGDSNLVVPAAGPTVPGAPTIGTATGGNTSVSVTFSAPGSNGGATIDSYRATCSPGGGTGTAASSPVTVSGLTNGTAYTCTVAAHNSVGWSAESAASNSATPTGGSCGPGETFPIGGTADAVWSGFNGSATYPSIGGEFASLGTSGVALQFVAGSNRGITLLAGFSGSGTTGSADVTISTCPHAYTTTLTGFGGTSWQCTRTGMTDLQNIWVSVIGSVNGNECLLTNGQTYYLNIRPNNGVAISKQLGYTIQ